MPDINIAIDGFAGCGKSSTAKAVATRLDYIYVDTGAMYRAITLHLIRRGVSLSNDAVRETGSGVVVTEPSELADALSGVVLRFSLDPDSQKRVISLNGEKVERAIRSLEVSNSVSQVARFPTVRDLLVAQQRELAREKRVVMDGRDIGTVVLPGAELKIFMSASIEARASRRLAEAKQQGHAMTLDQVIENLRKRDQIDSQRAVAPLRKAHDAIEIDTSDLNFEEQVEKVVNLAKERIDS